MPGRLLRGAPDQRGYGETLGWEADYDADMHAFGMLNLVRDVLGVVWALEIGRVAAVVGHDFGSPVAAYCALLRPDVFFFGRDDECTVCRSPSCLQQLGYPDPRPASNPSKATQALPVVLLDPRG
ncbi:MAG: hypothetical protein CM1200mP18_10160 [Gammaproteobacteria bacterium]|nr:MAG: hypothetical protein CM1200mP18_10160 [Gammaproteobacteria bacterium]